MSASWLIGIGWVKGITLADRPGFGYVFGGKFFFTIGPSDVSEKMENIYKRTYQMQYNK